VKTTRNRTMTALTLVGLAMAGLVFPGAAAQAALIFGEDFESSGSIPASMTFVQGDAGASAAITTGNGGGNGGRVIANSPSGTSNMPGGYLEPNVSLDFTRQIDITFDFNLPNEATADDMMVILGDLTTASGTPFSSFHVFVTEALANNDVFEANGGGRVNPGTSVNSTSAAAVIDSWATTAVSDDTWYSMSLNWTPTSGSTGVLSGATTGGSFATASYTLPATGTVGFGSLNDRVIVDNINISSATPPTITTATPDSQDSIVGQRQSNAPALGYYPDAANNVVGISGSSASSTRQDRNVVLGFELP